MKNQGSLEYPRAQGELYPRQLLRLGPHRGDKDAYQTEALKLMQVVNRDDNGVLEAVNDRGDK